ncbi:MAG: heme-binding beta-barrel domain-containing protein [Proteobacteria bacterium]|nr:heme-binding beta-barrel domain-containing protein [Pseudomonadota bacterium]
METKKYPPYGDDLFTEPANIDADTLRNLGPLTRLAGRWRGVKGVDVNPKADGPRTQGYIETFDLVPLDPQTNGPQLLYGLRYHQHVVKPGELQTYHDQIGYWLWEPATGLLMQTVSIPRGQTLLATGVADRDATRFELRAARGELTNGIVSSPFLDEAFTTTEYCISVTMHDDGSWSYEEDTVLQLRGRSEPFHHTDRNTLTLLSAPVPNVLARGTIRLAGG